ncbi:MAG: glycosyltransferase family 2 protein [Pseudomonadota bacterium]
MKMEHNSHDYSSKKNIMILIPAHNEEKIIEKTIKSVIDSKCLVDKEIYTTDIVVIGDNCTDGTVSIARSKGACVVKRTYQGALQGKGKTLDWFMHSYKDMVIASDYIAIIDADTIVAENFIETMINMFSCKNILVVQSFYDVLPPIEHWRTILLSVALRALHHTRASGRMFLGGTAGLKGNGMMFRSSILDTYGWPAHSIAEDAEFSAILACDDIVVSYVPETVVYGTMTHTYKDASEQRARWENGHWLMVKKWLPKFFISFFRKPSLLSFDGIMNCIIPPLSIFVGLQCVTIIVTYLLAPYLTIASCSFLLITTAYIFSSLVQTKAPLRLYLGLLCSPIYIVWKFWLYLTKIGRKTTVWQPSKREKR